MENLDINYKHSVYFREREDGIKYIVLHSTAFTPTKMIKVFNELKLSSHYIVGRKGEIYETVSPSKVAFHAGVSKWQNSQNLSLNDCSIGIELEAPTLGQKRSDFTKKQIASLIRLLNKLVKDYNIPSYNILGHSDIAVLRKPDPGALFPWKRLAEHGLGVWYDLRKTLKIDDEKELLSLIGYDVSNIIATRVAFCRHFNNKEIDCCLNVDELLKMPFAINFKIKDYCRYMKILRAVAFSFNNIHLLFCCIVSKILL